MASTEREPPSGATATMSTNRADERPKPVASGPDMAKLNSLISRYDSAYIDDKRSTLWGRLWVEDPRQHEQLALELKALGFRWADRRQAWYFPGN
jgi:transposase